MNLFSALENHSPVRPFDLELARCLHRLAPDTPAAVLIAAALASFAVSQGHAGLRLDAAAQLLDRDSTFDLPDPVHWQSQLAASRWVALSADPCEPTASDVPLVLEHGLLSLRRYREYGRQLAADLVRIGSAGMPAAEQTPEQAHLFARVFPDAAGDDPQAQAVRLAQSCPLLLLTGGPGTGKTTAIARVLLLRVAAAHSAGLPPPRIRLAAPTGKAAERMAASLHAGIAQFVAAGIDPALCAPLQVRAETVHRLLGVVPDSMRLRHTATNPLPADVLVIDEASMLDLPLMGKLAQAVAPGCQLILIGDPDQLPSVEAGDVLAALVAACTPPEPARFPARRIHLTGSHRQRGALDLAPLAAAVRASANPAQRARALDLLRGGTLANVFFHEPAGDVLDTAAAPLLVHARALMAAATPAAVLARINAARLLTAVREGANGARALNARIAARVQAGAPRRHFHGLPVLITENDYHLGLFNGDVGICLRDTDAADGALMVWFPGDEAASPRAVHPAALPAHEAAFALTVHKAQGSEFDRVWLLLPEQMNRSLSRELVYTAITRAREELHIVGRADVLAAALGNGVTRWSDLAWRLGVHSPA